MSMGNLALQSGRGELLSLHTTLLAPIKLYPVSHLMVDTI